MNFYDHEATVIDPPLSKDATTSVKSAKDPKKRLAHLIDRWEYTRLAPVFRCSIGAEVVVAADYEPCSRLLDRVSGDFGRCSDSRFGVDSHLYGAHTPASQCSSSAEGAKTREFVTACLRSRARVFQTRFDTATDLVSREFSQKIEKRLRRGRPSRWSLQTAAMRLSTEVMFQWLWGDRPPRDPQAVFEYARFALSNFTTSSSPTFEHRATSVLNPWCDIIRTSVQLWEYQGIAKSPKLQFGKKDIDKLMLYETIVNGCWAPGVCLGGLMAVLATPEHEGLLRDLRHELSSLGKVDLASVSRAEACPLLDAVVWEAIRLFHSPEVVSRQAQCDATLPGFVYKSARRMKGAHHARNARSLAGNRANARGVLFDEDADLAVFGCVSDVDALGETKFFRVRKGDVVLALMPLANRDDAVFGSDGDQFRPQRFLRDPSLKEKVLSSPSFSLDISLLEGSDESLIQNVGVNLLRMLTAYVVNTFEWELSGEVHLDDRQLGGLASPNIEFRYFARRDGVSFGGLGGGGFGAARRPASKSANVSRRGSSYDDAEILAAPSSPLGAPVIEGDGILGVHASESGRGSFVDALRKHPRFLSPRESSESQSGLGKRGFSFDAAAEGTAESRDNMVPPPPHGSHSAHSRARSSLSGADAGSTEWGASPVGRRSLSGTGSGGTKPHETPESAPDAGMDIRDYFATSRRSKQRRSRSPGPAVSINDSNGSSHPLPPPNARLEDSVSGDYFAGRAYSSPPQKTANSTLSTGHQPRGTRPVHRVSASHGTQEPISTAVPVGGYLTEKRGKHGRISKSQDFDATPHRFTVSPTHRSSPPPPPPPGGPMLAASSAAANRHSALQRPLTMPKRHVLPPPPPRKRSTASTMSRVRTSHLDTACSRLNSRRRSTGDSGGGGSGSGGRKFVHV